MILNNKVIETIDGKPIPKKEPTQKGRRKTVVTAVSVSNEFKDLIKEHKLKPTEVFRIGMAVSLADLGVHPYYNSLNKDRLKEVEEFLELKKLRDKIKESETTFLHFEKVTEQLKKDFNKISEIFKEYDKEDKQENGTTE